MRSHFSKAEYRGRELGLRIDRLGDDFDPLVVRNPRELYEFMRDIGSDSAERMYSVMMDARRNVSGVYLVSKGDVSTCAVDTSEIFKAALVTNSPVFALVHNHPSGDPAPSPEDIFITHSIAAGAEVLGLDFVDFMIIGNQRHFSFQEHDRMESFKSAAAKQMFVSSRRSV